MLESPDYFFRVREIGRLRQTIRTIPTDCTTLTEESLPAVVPDTARGCAKTVTVKHHGLSAVAFWQPVYHQE